MWPPLTSYTTDPKQWQTLVLTCGVNSSSSCPDRYWRSNSAFSPTYDAITRFKRCCFRSSPKPKSSTPALLLITVNSFMPDLKISAIRFSGIPHNPKPVNKLNLHSLMELSPSWEAANCAATQKLPSILWNRQVHYQVHKGPHTFIPQWCTNTRLQKYGYIAHGPSLQWLTVVCF
jgi:hypothetical protein